MKRVLFLIGFLFAVMVTANVIYAQGENEVAQILYMQGEVQVKVGASDWQPAEIEMLLNKGDMLRTGADSFVEITFGPKQDKNVIKAGENSTIKLDADADGINVIRLSSGKVFSLISKLARDAKFEIVTPTAIAGARGTGWSVESAAGFAAMAAFINSIYVKSFGQDGALLGEAEIDTGWKMVIELFQPPGDLLPITQEELDEWGKWYDEVRIRLAEFVKKYMVPADIALQAEAYEDYEAIWDEVLEDREDSEFLQERLDMIAEGEEEYREPEELYEEPDLPERKEKID